MKLTTTLAAFFSTLYFFADLCDAQPTNVALGGTASQSSKTNAAGGEAWRANDGNTNGQWVGNSVSLTQSEVGSFWKVDLVNPARISEIKIYMRTDCCKQLMDGFMVTIYNEGQETFSYTNPAGTPPTENIISVPDVVGDEVKVHHPPTADMQVQLAEVMVMGDNFHDFAVVSGTATADPAEDEITIPTTFGVDSHGAQIELMDQDCETYTGELLTLESNADTVFTNGGSFQVDTVIGIHPEHLEGTGNNNVLFPVGGEPITTQGEIIFCVKSHSTEETNDGNGGTIVIEMEVEKIRYTVKYDGSDTAFSTFTLDTDIEAEAIVTGATFEDGDLLEAGGLVFHRCTVDSTADSGDTSAAVEEEDFCLCIGPEENVGRVLSDINLNAVYGTTFDQTLPLVIGSSETLSVISVEANAEGTKFARLTVPILSEFIESGGTALRLSGDVDVGFAQDRRLQASGEGEKAFFEFVVELEGMKEVGCLGRMIARMNDIFF